MNDAVMITGASGFIGTHLARALEVRGERVIRCTRSQLGTSKGWRTYDLASALLPPDFFDGVRTVVHAAFVPALQSVDSFARNVRAAQVLAEAADRANVDVVFVSSLAAHQGARSEYGRQKYAIEQLLGTSSLVVRPGLVIGPGGIFGRLAAHVRSGKPIPLIDGGRQPLQTVYIDDLVASLLVLVRLRARGVVVLAEAPAVPYRQFFITLCSQMGQRNRLVDVPAWALLGLTNLAAKLGTRLPIERDNVLGLLEMRFMTPSKYDGLPRIRSYEAAIGAYLNAPRT